MNAKPIFITTVLSATLLAGCNQGADKSGAAPITPPLPTVTQDRERPQATPPAVQGSQTPASAVERKDGGAPVQGQVDTKEPVQRKAFEAPKG